MGESEVKMLQGSFAMNLVRLRDNFEASHRDLEAQYEQQVDSLKTDLELRRRVEIHEIEERKNQHINDLLTNHEAAFHRIKDYYNDITRDNLQLIRSLKDDIQDMRQREKANQKKMHELANSNKAAAQPLAEMEEKRAKLFDELKSYNKDKMALRNLRARSAQMEEKFRKLEKERDDLTRRFSKGVKEIRRRSEFKNLVLEKQLNVLSQAYQEKHAQLSDVLQSAKLEPQVVQSIIQKLEQVFGSKNKLIKELQYHAHQCTKQYNDTVRVYEAKLSELGIS